MQERILFIEIRDPSGLGTGGWEGRGGGRKKKKTQERKEEKKKRRKKKPREKRRLINLSAWRGAIGAQDNLQVSHVSRNNFRDWQKSRKFRFIRNVPERWQMQNGTRAGSRI